MTPNKPNSAKAAIAAEFHSGRQWRRLADSERSASGACRDNGETKPDHDGFWRKAL